MGVRSSSSEMMNDEVGTHRLQIGASEGEFHPLSNTKGVAS